MKSKVLSCSYDDGSNYQVVRVYLEKDFVEAIKDYEMMCQYASDCRKWRLEDVDVIVSALDVGALDDECLAVEFSEWIRTFKDLNRENGVWKIGGAQITSTDLFRGFLKDRERWYSERILTHFGK